MQSCQKACRISRIWTSDLFYIPQNQGVKNEWLSEHVFLNFLDLVLDFSTGSISSLRDLCQIGLEYQVEFVGIVNLNLPSFLLPLASIFFFT